MPDPLVAVGDKRVRDLFRVALVHLAAISLDEEFRHVPGENNTRPSALRHVVRERRKGKKDRAVEGTFIIDLMGA